MCSGKTNFPVTAKDVSILGADFKYVSPGKEETSNLRNAISWISTCGDPRFSGQASSQVDRRIESLESGKALVAGLDFNMIKICPSGLHGSAETVEFIVLDGNRLIFICETFIGTIKMAS